MSYEQINQERYELLIALTIVYGELMEWLLDFMDADIITEQEFENLIWSL